MAKRPNDKEDLMNKKTKRFDDKSIDFVDLGNVDLTDDSTWAADDDDIDFFENDEDDFVCSQPVSVIPETIATKSRMLSQSIIPETAPSRDNSGFRIPDSSLIIHRKFPHNHHQSHSTNRIPGIMNTTYTMANRSQVIPRASTVRCSQADSTYDDSQDLLKGENIVLQNKLKSMQAELEKERIERERLANEKEDQIKRYKKEIEDLKTVKGFQEYETRKRKSIEQNVSILGTQNGGNRLWLGRNTSLLSNDSMNESYGAAQPRHDDTPASASRHIFDTSDEDNDGVEEVLEEIVASTQQPTFGSPIITPPSAPYDHCRAERFREQNSELPSISDLNDSLDLDDISDVDLLHHKNRNAPNQRVHHETTFNATTRSTTTDHNQTEMIPDSLPIGRLPPQHLAANPIESKPIRLDAPKKPFNLYKTQLPNTLSKSKTLIHLLDRCIGLPNFNSVFARLERQLLSKRQIRFLFDQFKTDLLITQLTLDELRNVNDYHPLIRDWMQKCVISSTSLADSNVDIEPSLFNYIITFFKELRRQDIDRADWLRFYHSLFAFLNAHFVPLQDDCAVHPSECECIEWMTNSFGDFLLNLSHRLHDGSHQQFQLVQQVHTFIIILSQIRAFKQSSVLLAKMDHFTTQVNQLWAQLCATNMLNLNPSEDKSAARPNNN